MQNTYEVPKKEYLDFQIMKKEQEMSKIDVQINKLKADKEKIKESIAAIKEEHRDIFPARGRKKKV